jgi:hypothetical protein
METSKNKMKNKTFGALMIGALMLFTGCDGSTDYSRSQIQMDAQSIPLRAGDVRTVHAKIVDTQASTKQKISLSVSDPTVAHVAPSTCTLSAGDAPCSVTVFGKKPGNALILAEAPGHTSARTSVSVAGTISEFGTITVSSTIRNFYSGAQVAYPFSITVNLVPATGTDSKRIPNDNPLTVMMNQPAGISFAQGGIQQCNLTTANPSCTISGTIDAAQVSSKAAFSSTISPTGTWVAGNNAPFGAQDDITITWKGNPNQSAGTIEVASQNSSGQIFLGMKAPLFVYLTENTLLESNYWVTVTSTDPSALVFYSYPDGANTPADLQKTDSVTCALSLDNSSSEAFADSVTSCGYGLLPLKGTADGLDTALSVNVTTVPPSFANNQAGLLIAVPSYRKTVNLKLIDNSGTTDGRTITFTNASADKVRVEANAGSANAYTSPSSVAAGVNPTNPARTQAGAQSYCGPTAGGKNACPIGSTCVQGGAGVAKGKTPFLCFWDKPAFANGSGILLPTGQPGDSTTLFIPQWSGITTGPQQIQWSGNYTVLNCPGGTCPSSPTTPGTGPTYAANTLAEVTYQHNTVDYYDVSIINGANYALAFGPTHGQVTPNGYECGTPGESSPPIGVSATQTLSNWVFTPTATSFPTPLPSTDSPASYFAVVETSATTPTPCNVTHPQTACATTGSSGPVCGWDKSKVLSGTSTFAASDRICGTFVSWATANQIWGWNNNGDATYLNQAPFAFTTNSAVNPAFNGQTTISVSDLQLCINNSFSAYTDPAPTNQPAVMACGGTNWTGITTPSVGYTTEGTAWVPYVLPTITWLKKACPTCYTYPFDDMSSTFTCEKNVVKDGSNTLDYTIQISHPTNTFD